MTNMSGLIVSAFHYGMHLALASHISLKATSRCVPTLSLYSYKKHDAWPLMQVLCSGVDACAR